MLKWSLIGAAILLFVGAAVAQVTAPFSVTVSTGAVEVPGPSPALYAAPFYSCARNFYVATNGSDSNSGTQAQPWLTIQHADSSARTGGDCINVAPGTYQQNVLIQHGGTGPTPTGYVVYRCQTLDGCHVLAPGGGHLWGFIAPTNPGPNSTGGNFVVVDGFEIDGNNALKTDGVADACLATDANTYGTPGVPQSAHHIWSINNIIHHCNLAGISFNSKEWFYAIHNRVYHNSWTSGYQGSGVAYVVLQCIESGNANCYSGSAYVPSGMDLTYAPPFHNVVAWNDVFYNKLTHPAATTCGSGSDGNGIIMDTFYDGVNNTIQYPYQTIVVGNAAYLNGARGIHVFQSSFVTVANNTAYGNGTDNCLNAYVLGDLSEQGGTNNVWVNNTALAVYSPANPSCGTFCGHNNSPFVAGNGGGVTDVNNTFSHNVTFGGEGVALFDNDVNYYSCSNNLCTSDPKYVNPGPNYPIPGNNNFALQATSPAIGYGLTEPYLSAQQSIDAGACYHTLTSCP